MGLKPGGDFFLNPRPEGRGNLFEQLILYCPRL
jgi:hypothetical protein